MYRVASLRSKQNSLCFSCDFNIFSVSTYIYIIYSTTTTHREIYYYQYTKSQMQQSLLQKFHSIIGLSPYSKFASKPKDCSSIPPQSWYILKLLKIFPVLEVNFLCRNIFKIYFCKFPVFSLSEKMNIQIPCSPCFPCAVATLI